MNCTLSYHEPEKTSSKAEQIIIDKIDEVERSVLKIACSSFYDNFNFQEPLPDSQLSNFDLDTEEKRMTTNTVAGTGLILLQNPKSILLISAYHLFDFEDTVKTFYMGEDNYPTNLLRSLSIKTGDVIFVNHKNGTNSRGKILAVDEVNDLALIETPSTQNSLSERPFLGKMEKSVNLKLGEQVYLLGFPRGFFMVSRGLASPSKYNNKFIVDTSFNRGSSGSVVFTIDLKNNVYTYVGMANMMAYDSQTVLAPADNSRTINSGENLVYTGETYLKELKMINYGLTFVVKSDVVCKLLQDNRILLNKYGFLGIDNLIGN